MVSGNDLYKFTGQTSSEWTWEFIKKIDWMVKDNFAEFAIEKSALSRQLNYYAGNAKIGFYGANSYISGNEDDSVYILHD